MSRPLLGYPGSPWELFCGININLGDACTVHRLLLNQTCQVTCSVLGVFQPFLVSVSSNGISAIHFLLAGFSFSGLNFVSLLFHSIFLTPFNTVTMKYNQCHFRVSLMSLPLVCRNPR